jgi:EAL domain-containing protein (putative c-di-GMP-specific phosphodiesterase class I)
MTISTLHNYPQAHLAMNVSGSTATDPRWFTQLTDIIAANRSVADRRTVEITETVALADLKETFSFVEALRNIGCSVAIDDFGAGFTSFRNLRDLPVNIIKLDGSFCCDLKQNSGSQYLARTLIDLSHKFNLKTIAEWVETEDDAEILQSCGIDLMQGNLFGQASLELPWARKEIPGFVNFDAVGQFGADLEKTKVFAQDVPVTPPTPIEVAEAPDSAVMEEGLSRLKLAIRALDEGFRKSPALDQEFPLAEAG